MGPPIADSSPRSDAAWPSSICPRLFALLGVLSAQGTRESAPRGQRRTAVRARSSASGDGCSTRTLRRSCSSMTKRSGATRVQTALDSHRFRSTTIRTIALSARPRRPVNAGNSNGCVWAKRGPCRPCVQPPPCRRCARPEHPTSSVHLTGCAPWRRGSPSLPPLAGVPSRPARIRAAAPRAAARAPRRARLRAPGLTLAHRPAPTQA
jgi:hypothetical protein